MRALRPYRSFLLASALSGCSTGFGIELTVEPTCIVAADTLEITATLAPSGRMQTGRFSAAPFLLNRPRVVLVVPDGTTSATVTAAAKDIGGTTLGTGTTVVAVSGHQLVSATLTINAPACQDGGLGDAGAGDASAGDAGAPLFACPSFAIFCDDFELGNISRWSNWVTTSSEATISANPSNPHTGNNSLEARVRGSAAAIADVGKAPLALPNFTLMVGVRFYLFWPSAPGDRVSPLGLGSPANDYFNITQVGGAWAIKYRSALEVQTATAVPVTQWICTELVLSKVNPPLAGTRVQLFADNVQVIDYISSGTTQASELYVGLPQVPAGPSHVFIDDIAVAARRVGCP